MTATDTVGNSADHTIGGINIDLTPPTILIETPTTVSPADRLTVNCTATDSLSGIETTRCATLEIDASSLDAGINTFEFIATDLAGNATTATAAIYLDVTIDSLADLIDLYLGDTPGAKGQHTALVAHLEAHNLTSFTEHVNAKCCTPSKGKRFNLTQADTLIRLATQLTEP